MTLRSFLFVPGDSDKKLSKGDASGADALILDLEDPAAPSRNAIARDMVCDYLMARPPGARAPELWVRMNPIYSGGLDGKMRDTPHLKKAEQVLARAKPFAHRSGVKG
jgi:citrate lyase subunit beta / citryl-CoA lyase